MFSRATGLTIFGLTLLVVVGATGISIYQGVTACSAEVKSMQGTFVKILVSGQKGQVVNIGGGELGKCILHVRVNSHGIALDGGNWNTAKPEVLPVLKFQPFELEPWKE